MLKRQHMHQLSTLTAGMVHDIRNPLNGISAIMEALLTECGERVDLGDYQHHLRSQLTRLSSLLQDIQTLGTPHESEFLQQLDLVQLCRHSTNLWQRARAPQPLPSLTLQLPSHPLTISADPQKMQHALFNLLDNAARHSPPASSITLALQPLGPHWAQLSVSDEGQGITEAALPRILEPFFTTHKGSNGLGLPIVKNIVTMLEGTLEINNRDPASGVCATIRLPLVDYTP
jgi:signal transduction histidine kinase